MAKTRRTWKRGDTVVPGRVITWPDWRKAKPGQRVRYIRTGRTGTVTHAPRREAHAVLRVQWDNDALGRPVAPGTGVHGRVVGAAFELEPIS